ncbi:MAG: SRPBCC domain-containing protein [Pseudomonadota bacterium]
MDHFDIANFDDRYTMRFVRRYDASVERVWRAVTSDELNIWLYPVTRVELKVGGRATFTWGQAEDNPQVFKVTKLETCQVIRFASTDTTGRVDHRGFMQFNLEPDGEGTLFTFTQRMSRLPESERVPQSDAIPKDAAQPGGPDNPFKPGFVAGFHLNMDALGAWLTGDGADWSDDQISSEAQKLIDFVNDGQPPERADEIAYETGSPRWQLLVEVYFDHLTAYLPNEKGVSQKNPEHYIGLSADIASRQGPAHVLERSQEETSETQSGSTEPSEKNDSAGGRMNFESQEHIVYIKTTREALWEALTSPELSMKYHLFVAVDSEFRKGSPIVYKRPGLVGVTGTITSISKYKKLSYEFTHFGEEKKPPSLVTWHIYDRGHVQKVKLIHEGLLDEKMYNRQMKWWTVILSGLKTLLETGEPLMMTYERA